MATVEVVLAPRWSALPERMEQELGPVGTRHEVVESMWGLPGVKDCPFAFYGDWFRPVTTR